MSQIKVAHITESNHMSKSLYGDTHCGRLGLSRQMVMSAAKELTLCILIDPPMHTISMRFSVLHFKGHSLNFLNYCVFLSLKVVLILANSADPDEMQH